MKSEQSMKSLLRKVFFEIVIQEGNWTVIIYRFTQKKVQMELSLGHKLKYFLIPYHINLMV